MEGVGVLGGMGYIPFHRLGPAMLQGGQMSTEETNELLSEIRALRQEVLEIKLQMARQEGENLSEQVHELSNRVTRLELWRAGLIAATSASGAGALTALSQVFGG